MSNFNAQTYWDTQTAQHTDVAAQSFASLQNDFESMLKICTQAIENDNKIFFAGNGGSAADAQHLATELTIRFIKDRKPIAGIALTTDTSSLTAAGNDFGFDHIFARQLEALGKSGDVLIAISTSGNSANILQAINAAKTLGVKTIGWTGQSGGQMSNLCDAMLKIPSQTTARIQEMHITFGHLLCGALEQKLGLVEG